MPSDASGPVQVAVVGHAGRDIVLVVDEVPPSHGTRPVRQRLELPGGKGYNQAAGLAQLGHRPILLGAVGDDGPGRLLLDWAGRDGIDTSAMQVRPRAATALVVSVIEPEGAWRYLEDLPPDTFVRPEDIEAHRRIFLSATVTSLQMQEPPEATLAAARLARSGGRLVVADGAPDPSGPVDELLSLVSVLRADEREARLLTGIDVEDARGATDAARAIQAKGPDTVIVAAGADGNVVAWEEGTRVVPLPESKVVDSTGGGDALVAGTISGLLSGSDPFQACCLGVAAAASVVSHPGGRPHLDAEVVRRDADRIH